MFVQLWRWLLSPHESIKDQEVRSRATLLDRVLIALVISLGGIILYYVDRGNTLAQPDLLVAVLLWASFLVMFVLGRARRITPAIYALVIVTILVTVFLPFVPGSQTNLLYFALLPILLAGVFLGPSAATVVGVGVVLGALALSMLEPSVSFLAEDADATPIIVYLILITSVILVYANHNRLLETIRRKQLESLVDSLRESESLLEQRVVERTEELNDARKEAESARDRAVAADQSKLRFIAAASHELQTPLNAIVTFTDFVASGIRGPVNQEQRDSLESARDSARSLLAVIEDMLDVSKLETGALQLAMEDDVRLEPVLHQVRNTAEGLVAHKPVRIELDVADPLPPLRCDQRRIHQAILNLVSNACQYTQRGHVRIRARRELDELLVEVEDTGPGIGFEDQALIFEAFRQDRPELEVGTGPGLGLPIASHLARAHRGRLWLKSAPGYGSTFYLALPLDQVDA